MKDKKSIRAELKDIKINKAVRHLNIAHIILIILNSFNFLKNSMTVGLFSNAEEKLTILFLQGVLVLINNYVNKFKDLAPIVSFIFGEILNLLIIIGTYCNYQQLNIFWALLSPLVAIYYQSHLTETKLSIFLMSFKYTSEWVLLGFFYSKLNIQETWLLVQVIFGIFILISCCSYASYIQNLEICLYKAESVSSYKKLITLLESFPKFITVLSHDKKVLFSNSLLLQLIGDHETILDYLSVSKYYQRYEGLDKVAGVLEDVLKSYKLPRGSRAMYGITEKKGIFVEWEGKIDLWDDKPVLILIGRDVGTLLKLKKDSQESSYKTTLLSTVSHELRSPTNSMLIMAQSLLESPELSNNSKEKAQIITCSCNYQLCLINDLLDYSQIMSGCFKTVKVYFSLIQLLKECLKYLEIELMHTNIKTELKIKSPIPDEINTDPYRMKQIITNLLSNSRKFTRTGKISLIVSLKENILKISCKDTGIGLEEKDKLKLFKIFSKIEDSVNNPQGSGLGLYISNMLVRVLGGDCISLKSALGKGSKFSFKIPVEYTNNYSMSDIPEENPKIKMPLDTCMKFKDKTKVLIVDDMYFNILTFRKILEPEGILCSYALNGIEAIKLVKESKYDCIIMDCEMPIMDGLEATEIINKMFANREILKLPPIIGYTSHSNIIIHNKCKKAGMNDIIVKPCVREEILMKINHWIRFFEFL